MSQRLLNLHFYGKFGLAGSPPVSFFTWSDREP